MKENRNDIVEPDDNLKKLIDSPCSDPQLFLKGSIRTKDKNATPKISAHKVDFETGDYNRNFLDNIVADSEDGYRRVVEKIVGITDTELRNQSNSKKNIKKIFTTFFISFVSVQYVALVMVLIMLGFDFIQLAEPIIITYMTSVFAETLGAVIIMIQYAFSSKQEVQLIKILNNAIENYKKYNEKG